MTISVTPHRFSGMRRDARATLGDRLDRARQLLAAVDRRERQGLSRAEAESCLESMKPYFGEISLREEAEEGAWYLVIDFYRCPGCQTDFDARDLRSVLAGGEIRCPKCETMVVAPAAAAEEETT